MIKPWLFEFFHAVHDLERHADPATVQEHYRSYLDLWVGDEERGFEGIFFSEHHFGPGYSPAPNLLIANLAARTTRMRLGVLGSVSAHNRPWRIAEEFAMLDHLTGGRLEIGVVSGIPPEMALVGVTPPLAAEVHAETLDVLLAAVEKPAVAHHGTHFSFEVNITPAFLQTSPTIWTAAVSEASARRAGERGLKVCFGFTAAEQLAEQRAAFEEGARSSGMPTGPERIGIRRQIELVEDEADSEEAGRKVKEGAAELMRFSFEAMKIPDAPPKSFHPDELIYGTPSQVTDEIIRQCRIVGAGNFLASFNIFDRERLRANHDLFGGKVIPRLRAADIA